MYGPEFANTIRYKMLMLTDEDNLTDEGFPSLMPGADDDIRKEYESYINELRDARVNGTPLPC